MTKSAIKHFFPMFGGFDTPSQYQYGNWVKIQERLKTVGGAANLFQSFRHMSAFLALGTIYLQLLT